MRPLRMNVSGMFRRCLVVYVLYTRKWYLWRRSLSVTITHLHLGGPTALRGLDDTLGARTRAQIHLREAKRWEPSTQPLAASRHAQQYYSETKLCKF